MPPRRTSKKSAVSRASRTTAVRATSPAGAPPPNDNTLGENNVGDDDATKTRPRQYNWFSAAYVSDDAYESDERKECILPCLCTLTS